MDDFEASYIYFCLFCVSVEELHTGFFLLQSEMQKQIRFSV